VFAWVGGGGGAGVFFSGVLGWGGGEGFFLLVRAGGCGGFLWNVISVISGGLNWATKASRPL